MPNPQNPELRRSEEILRPRPELGPDPQDVGGGETGPVPAENQAGHHPDQDQDKPPAEAFAAALGIKSDREVEADETDEQGGMQSPTPDGGARPAKRQGAAAKAPAKKATAKKAADVATAPAKKAADVATAAAKKAADVATAPAKKAAAQKAAAKSTAARSGTGTTAGTSAKPAAAKATPKATISSSGTSAGRSASAGRGPGEAVSMGTAGATSKAVSADAPAQAESPAQAAAQHHHALPDEQLPHDAGFVTPTGTPVTTRVLTVPLKYWGAALRTGGGAIVAYGEWVRRTGERLTSGRRR